MPTGALLGLDAVLAAAEGEISSVLMTTRKPPAGLLGAPYLVANGIDVAGLSEPTLVFEGSARDAAIGFPANVNVAVALSLAGIGADKTRIAIWADPSLTRNVHRIEVDSDAAAKFSMTIENIPSENPRTGRISSSRSWSTLTPCGACEARLHSYAISAKIPVPHLSPEMDQGNALELTRARSSCPWPETRSTWTNEVSGQR